MQNPTDYQIDDKGRLNSDGLYQKVKKNEEQAIQCLLDMGAAFDAEFLSYGTTPNICINPFVLYVKSHKIAQIWRDGKVQTTDGKLCPDDEELKQQAINALLPICQDVKTSIRPMPNVHVGILLIKSPQH